MSDAAAGRDRLHGLMAVIACIVCYGAVLALAPPLLGLLMERRGIDASVIGLVATAPALATLAAAPLVPAIAARLGVRRFLLGCLAIEALCFLALPATDDIWLWFAIRFVAGATGVGLFVASETWINTLAVDAWRGRVLSLYNMALAGSVALGPLVIAVLGSDGWAPFLVGAAIVLVAAVPLAFAPPGGLELPDEPGLGLLAFAREAPHLVAAAALTAFMFSVAIALMPVWGVRHGLSEAAAAGTVSVIGAGNILLPLFGWLADRMDRRRLLAGVAAAGTACCLLLPAAVGSPWLLWPLVGLLGALSAAVYTIAMVLLGQQYQGRDLLAGNAALGVGWGAGSLAGPALGGFAMSALDPDGLPLAMAAACAAYAVWLLGSRRG